MKLDNFQVVYTNKAKCRDCYKCIRYCDVKAINMKDGQAYVDAKRCINCGNCINICPQGAKTYTRALEQFQQYLSEGANVAISLAPSFAAYFDKWQLTKLPSFFRSIGCSYVAETAIGAHYVREESNNIIANNINKSYISSSCPAATNFIEKYHSQLNEYFLPLVSPMLAHAKIIKNTIGLGTKVIFIGPCIAKIGEASHLENRDLVDLVLTFDEISELMNKHNIDLHNYEDSDFDEYPLSDSGLYPIDGKSLDSGINDIEHITAKGFEEITNALDYFETTSNRVYLEVSYCSGGCLNGSANSKKINPFIAEKKLLDFQAKSHKLIQKNHKVSLKRIAQNTFKINQQEHETNEILEVLKLTGKLEGADELNCGACGYDTCRDKAKAVLENRAEPEMCIPFMRKLAERRSDKIMQSSPNGIVILDDNYKIIQMNKTFKNMFSCNESIMGKQISYLMDPEHFIKFSSLSSGNYETTIKLDNYNILAKLIIYKLEDENQIVGVFVNITSNSKNSEIIKNMKRNTIEKARILLNNQIELAQNIAQMLGESTADSEELIENLIELTNVDSIAD